MPVNLVEAASRSLPVWEGLHPGDLAPFFFFFFFFFFLHHPHRHWQRPLASKAACKQTPRCSSKSRPHSYHHHSSKSSPSSNSKGHPLLAKRKRQQKKTQIRRRSRGKGTPRSSNSSSDALPGRRQLKRTMLDLREDVEEVQDEVSSLRLRMLWLMSQEVRRERQEVAQQLITQGFDTRTESSNLDEAMRQRDKYIQELLERLLRASVPNVQYTSSHSTSLGHPGASPRSTPPRMRPLQAASPLSAAKTLSRRMKSSQKLMISLVEHAAPLTQSKPW